MKRIVVIVLILLTLPLVAALSGMVDLGAGKNLLSGALSRALGRELRIDGDLELHLGGTPRIAARDIVVANPDWVARDLVRIEQFELELDLISLWRGPIRIEHLLVVGADANLVEREDGSNNWSFGEATEESRERQDDSPGIQLPVIIVEGRVSKSLVRFMQPRLDRPAELRLDNVRIYPDAEHILQLELQGRLGHLPLEGYGRAGDYAALLSGENIELSAQLELAAYRLTVQGRLGRLALLEDLDLDVQFTGPDSTILYEALHLSQPDSGPVDLSARVRDLSAGLAWSVQGQFGSLKLNVDGAMAQPLALDGVQSTFDVSGANLQLVTSWLGIDTPPPQPFQLQGAVSREGDKLEIQGLELSVGQATLHADVLAPHFPGSRDISVVAGIEGPSIARFRQLLGLQGTIDVPFDLDVLVQDRPDGLEILDSELRVGGIALKVVGPIGDYPGLEGSDLRFELEGESLRNLLQEVDIQGAPDLPYRATGALRTTSPNQLELTESLLELAGLSISIEGVLNDVAALDDSALRIRMETESLAATMDALGQQGLPAEAASLSASLSGPLTDPVVTELAVRLGTAWVQFEGALRGFPYLDGSQANMRGEIADSADWLPGQLQLPLTLLARLSGADQQFWLDALMLESPQWQLEGGLHVSDLERRLGTLQLIMKGPTLGALLPPVEGFEFAATPFRLEADIMREEHSFAVNKLQLAVADNRLVLDGTLSDDADALLSLDIQGLSLASLGVAEAAVLPSLPYSLKGHLGRAGTRWSVDDLDVRLGEQELLGSLGFVQGEHPRYSARLRSQRFDLGQFVAAPEKEPAQSPVADVPATSGDRLIPDTPLPLAWLDSFDAELDLDLGGLGLMDPGFPELLALDSVRLRASLEGGTLSARQLDLSGDRGTLSIPMTLQWQDGVLDADLAIQSEQIKLSVLSKSYNVEGLPEQRIRSRLRARGANPRQLAASLQGYLLLESGSGKLNNGNMGIVLDSFTSQLMETVNPFFAKDPYTELECGVVGVEFDKGTARLDPGAIFRTSKMDIMATGKIRLDTEALKLSVATKARKGLGISAASLVTPFLEVTGTLADPGLGIDTTSAAITGGAAAATGGLSILASSLWNRYMNKTDPCELASQKAQQRLDETGAESAG